MTACMRLRAGIGEATVRRFHADGSTVVIADISDAAGQALATELGVRAFFMHCDVTCVFHLVCINKRRHLVEFHIARDSHKVPNV